MSESEYYGFTCDKCTSRGLRDVVGDFVPVERWEATGAVRMNFYGEIDEIHAPTVRWIPVGFPERCKECNANYQRKKTAMEAIRRCEIIRRRLMLEPGEWPVTRATENARGNYEFLKFVTLTWGWENSTSNEPPADEAMKRYLRVREKVEKIGCVGGTDVLECVTTENEDGTYYHHLHFHGVWICPQVDLEEWRTLLDEAGCGRDQIRACTPHVYTCKYSGEQRVQSAFSRAATYLSKYLSKQNLNGRRRIVWGDLRRWKLYVEHCGHFELKNASQLEQRCDVCELIE